MWNIKHETSGHIKHNDIIQRDALARTGQTDMIQQSIGLRLPFRCCRAPQENIAGVLL
jgi:hypothetical protein